MRIVVAMDSFKGSLTSSQAGNAVAGAARKLDEAIEVLVRPLADGGEMPSGPGLEVRVWN